MLITLSLALRKMLGLNMVAVLAVRFNALKKSDHHVVLSEDATLRIN
jgi:hypothetical protein